METGSRRHSYLRPLGGAGLAVRAMMGSEHEEPIDAAASGSQEGYRLVLVTVGTVVSIGRLVCVFAGRSVKVSSLLLRKLRWSWGSSGSTARPGLRRIESPVPRRPRLSG